LDRADDYKAIEKLLRRWESGGTLPPAYFDPRFKDEPALKDPMVLRAVLAPHGKEVFRDQAKAARRYRAVLALHGNATTFRDQAKAARRYAHLCPPDKGSRPRSRACDTLCIELIDGFKRATKRKPTSTGDYFRLVKAVWTVACDIAETVTERSAEPSLSTPAALRKRLQRLFKRLGC
jgi:hypothetical protein